MGLPGIGKLNYLPSISRVEKGNSFLLFKWIIGIIQSIGDSMFQNVLESGGNFFLKM